MDKELEFERPVRGLERQIATLRRLAGPTPEPDLAAQIARLEAEADRLLTTIFGRLDPWQTVQLARHPERPHTLDVLQACFTDFSELHGDRLFGDDAAIVGGPARLDARRVMVIGQQKGRSLEENVTRNFGMPQPEGYRKAVRLMELAERFEMPVVTLIDTPGAYPGQGAEERGQARAIAHALERMVTLKVPMVATVIGEGGSGGALALGMADQVLMFEHAVYSVISPEGCASILFSDATRAAQAAAALRLTARDLLELGVVDQIVPEPLGGAHRRPESACESLKSALHEALNAIPAESEAREEKRYLRWRALGRFEEAGA